MAQGRPLAEAFVRIAPDASGFGVSLKRQVQTAVEPAAKIVDQSLVTKLGEKLQVANQKVARSQLDVRQSELNLAAAREKLTKVTEDANATDEQRARATLAVEKAEVRHTDALNSVGRAQSNVGRTSGALRQALAGESTAADKAAAAQRKLADDTDHASGSHRALTNELHRQVDVAQLQTFAQKIRDIRVLSSATLAPVKSLASQVGKFAVVAGGVSAALVGGVGLVGGLLTLAGALAQVSGAAPLAVTALGSLGALFAVTKVSTLGVADGIKSVVKANQALVGGEKLTKAQTASLNADLARLAPNAKQFVLQINDMLPPLRRLQQGMQQLFFARLANDVRSLGERYIPTLSRAGTQLSAVLGNTLHASLKSLDNSTTQWQIAAVLSEARVSAQRFGPVLAQLPKLLVAVADAAIPAFHKLTAESSHALSGVFTRIKAAIDSGALARGIDRGVAALKSLGSIAGSVFSALHSAVKAASAVVGGSLLGSISQVLKQFATFAKSAQGQDTLRGLFAAALPVLHSFGLLLQIVGPQLAALAPVVLNLAQAFIEGLTPVIPVAVDLAKAVGGAILPILPAVSQLAVALGKTLTQAIGLLQPVLDPLAQAVGSLLSPTGVLTAALAAFAPVLPVIAQGLARVVSLLSGGFAAVLKELAPKLPALATAVSDLAVALAQGLADAMVTLTPVLVSQIENLTELAAAVAPLIVPLAKLAAGVLAVVGPVLTLISPITLLADSLGKLNVVTSAITDSLGDAGVWTKDLGNSTSVFAQITDDAAEKLRSESTAADTLSTALDKLNGKALNSAEASISFKNSLDNLATAAAGSKLGLDENTKAGRNNRSAFIAAIKAAQNFGATVGDTSGPEAGRQALIRSRDELVRVAGKLHLNKVEAAAMIAQYFKIPPHVKTDAELRIEQAKRNAAEINRRIGKISGKTVDIVIRQDGSIQNIQREINSLTGKAVSIQVGPVRGGGASGNAAGTNYAMPGWSWVGEEGPELIHLAGGEKILNAQKSRMLASIGRKGGTSGGYSAAGTVQLDPSDRALLRAAVLAMSTPIEVTGTLVGRGTDFVAVIDRTTMERSRR